MFGCGGIHPTQMIVQEIMGTSHAYLLSAQMSNSG